MDADERALLEQCMAAMAAGDEAFVFSLHRAFAPRVEVVVRGMVAEMGRRDVLADRDEVDGLVQDACFVILERASGWRPDGALPWTWAARAIRAEVARRIGHRTVGIDGDIEGDIDGDIDGEMSGGAAADGGAATHLIADDVGALASRDGDLAMILSAVRAVGSERDQRVYLEFRLQKRLGDPSPAHTVAAAAGLSPANVRQIVRRHTLKVRQVLDDPMFAPVRDAAIFAA